jgi:hypothetical protein
MRKAIGALVALVALGATSPSEAYVVGRRDSSAVLSALTQASQRHGIPLGTMLGFGRIESGLRPRARTGSYKGLFQLSDKEFRRYGGGNIYDEHDNANAFARLTLVNMAKFRAATGRNPTGSELYLMHQQGEAGAAAHLRNPSAPAWVNMYSTGEGRRKGPGWAKKAIWGNVPDRWKKRFGSVENVTSGDFVEMWKRTYQAKEGWKSGTTVASANIPRIPSKARAAMDDGSREKSFRVASENLGLNKREQALYRWHLDNLWGSGGVTGEMGNRSTLMATTVGFGGRTYLIPTVWDGKIVDEDEAVLRAKKMGLRNFPQYKSVKEAQARYSRMHDYMDMDTEQWTNVQASAEWKPPQVGYSELDTQSAEMAADKLPPPPPSFSVVVGGRTVPKPLEPGTPTGSPDVSVIASRKPEDAAGASANEFFTSDRLDDIFGKPFGQLYAEGRIPEPPAKPLLLRDLFGAA